MEEGAGTRILMTPRLTLRPFAPGDAETVFRNWAGDPAVARFMTWTAHPSPEMTRTLTAFWCAMYREPGYYNWGVVFGGELIGSVSVVKLSPRTGCAELSYCIGRRWWGRGIMTEAVTAVRDMLFAEAGAESLRIDYAAANPASGRVAGKCGFKSTEYRRHFYRKADGEWWDVVTCRITREEWERLKTPEKAEKRDKEV